VSRRRRWTLALAALGLFVAVMAAPTAQLRHLALPVIHDPSIPSPATRLAIADGPRPTGAAMPVATLPGRISAILPRADGVVFVGTFDAGLYRFDPAHDAAPVELGDLAGRERFVDALVEHDGHVVAATHRGAVILAPDGRRLGVIAAGEAVAALAVVDGRLVAGTAHGLWTAHGPLGERGPAGETLRVTALAPTTAALYIGTADGVYRLARPLGSQVAAAWHPLVFGTPPAATNVVTALAPLGDGVVAGTDDGGLVLVSAAAVRALPFWEARANDVNPGALAPMGNGVVVGTEGAGLLALDPQAATVRRLGPRAAVSAVAAGARLWFGTADGALFTYDEAAASRIFWINAS